MTWVLIYLFLLAGAWLFLRGAYMNQSESDEIGRMLVELQKREDDDDRP